MTNARYPRHDRSPRRSATARDRGALGRRTYRRLNIERLEIRDLLAIMAGLPVAATDSRLPPSMILGPVETGPAIFHNSPTGVARDSFQTATVIRPAETDVRKFLGRRPR